MRQENWICDVCGEEIDRERLLQISVPEWFMFSKSDRHPFIDNWEIKAQYKVHKTSLDLCDNCAEKMANVLYDNFNIGEKE